MNRREHYEVLARFWAIEINSVMFTRANYIVKIGADGNGVGLFCPVEVHLRVSAKVSDPARLIRVGLIVSHKRHASKGIADECS